MSDSSSDTSTTSNNNTQGKKKKAGVNNKVNIPEFGGKKSNPHDAPEAFRDWAQIVSHYQEYYEDEYLMTQVVSSLKSDASRVFDWVRCNHHRTGDLGFILQKMRNHYSATLTFREQCNEVENLRQAPHEDATDFLIQVSDAVQTLGSDWKNLVTPDELETLQYEVCLNGVTQDIRHVLDTEAAKYGELNSDQMYDAAKHHEAFIARKKRLQGKATPLAGSSRAPQTTNSGYKPQFQKTTAFAANALEPSDSHLESPEVISSEVLEEGLIEIDPGQEEAGGLYLPDFLTGEGNDVLNMRMARAIQADE